MFIVAPVIDSTEIAIVVEADLRCGDFCPKKYLSQIGSYHWLLVLATECFFSFDNQKIQRHFFWVFIIVNALWVC